jgi:hypothetical protein
MKTLIPILLVAIICTGCESFKRSFRGEKQPILHIPGRVPINNEASHRDTNFLEKGFQIEAFTVPDVIGRSNTISSVTNGTAIVSNAQVSAYLQIASSDDVSDEFGPTFSRCFYVGEVVIENLATNYTLLSYSSSLQVEVAYYVAESDWGMVSNNMLRRFGKEYISDVRRPATYSDILAIFEFQRKSNRRQQVFDYFKSAGEIAAGATMFIGGAAYPRAVSFVTGIVAPELEKRLLWDVLLHAKNLETRSMKEVEEIAPGASIHKIVFFPKSGLPGILDGCPVYISSFKAYQPIVVRGSFITKVAPAASGKITPNE